MPIIPNDIKKIPISQMTNLNFFNANEEYNFVLQNSSIVDLDDFDLNGLPELKLTRQNGGYYGRCSDELEDFDF